MDRFPPIAAQAMTPAQRTLVEEISSGPRGGLRGPFPALLHNPPLFKEVASLGEHLRFRTGIPNALLEMAIIMTARHWTAQYEWFAHARLARNAGLDPAIIEAIAADRTPAKMSPDEAIIHRFASELLAKGAPSDAAFDAASGRFGRAGTLDLIALVGYYSMVGMILNTAQVAVPDGTVPLAPRG